MTRAVVIAVIVLAFAPQRQVFRSGVDGIRVDVLVMDGRTPVAGLREADFSLVDNGVPQKIDSLEFGDVPLSVVVVLDTSDSLQGFRLDHLKTAATRALTSLTRRDAAALLEFRHELALSDYTNDPASLGARATAASAEGGTSLHDAVFAALLRSDSRLGRPLILIFSDGQDTASWLPAEAVYAAARRTDAVIYAVSLKDIRRSGPYVLDYAARLPLGIAPAPRGTPFLNHLVAETGGSVFLADTPADIESRFLDVLREFKSRYLLTYTPQGVPHDGWHPIQVTVKRAGAKVSARRGYAR
jgi:VWFA-related protein